MDPNQTPHDASLATGPTDPTQAAPSQAPPHAPGHAAGTPPVPPIQDAGLAAEIDEAMAAMGFGQREPKKGDSGDRAHRARQKQQQPAHAHDVAPIGGPAKPALKGPRVVSAGREHRTGAVISVGPSDIFVEFGPKELGVAPRLQWKDEELPAVGSQLEVVVDKFEPSENLFVCSRPGSVVKAAWENLEIGQVVEGRVVATNKGGLEIEIASHRAFMPASQVSLDRIPDLSVMIGEKIQCQISQIDKRGKGNIVLSRRDLLQKEREEKGKKLRESLEEGQTLDGTVRKIMPFGAFVDIGGLDGLVHISDLTYDRVGFGEQAIAKHVKEGQSVKVKVLKIDWDNNKISLGLKQLAADPFQTAVADIKEGAEIAGRVTRLADFGAFIELAPGVEGLCHVSEIAHRRIGHPQDELKQDQIVQCKVLKLDPTTRRISLSLKAMLAAPEPMGGGGGGGGPRGKKGERSAPGRSEEEIKKETPALRRLRAQAALRTKTQNLKGGF